MLRFFVAVLCVGNLILFGWIQGWYGSLPNEHGREPERLTHQISPQAIRLSPSTIAVHEGQEGQEIPAPTDTASAELPLGEGERTVGEQTAALFFCLEAGPLHGEQAMHLQNIVKQSIPDGLWEMDVYAMPSSWAVYIGPFASEQVAIERKAQLDAQKVESVLVRNKPQYEPGLTLGLFRDQSNANSLLNKLQLKGVNDVKIQAWAHAPTGQLLRVKEASLEQKEHLEKLVLNTNIPSFISCKKQ